VLLYTQSNQPISEIQDEVLTVTQFTLLMVVYFLFC